MHFCLIDLDSLLIGYYGDHSVDLISGSSYWRIFIIHDDLCYVICNDFSIRFEYTLPESSYTQVRYDLARSELAGRFILGHLSLEPLQRRIWALNAIKYTTVDTIYIFEHPTKISANGKTEKWLAWNEASETNENETIQEAGWK